MGRKKKEIKLKEPVRIREKRLNDGNISLYLDMYHKGARKKEGRPLIDRNPFKLLDAKEKPQKNSSIREFLTIEEVKQLMATPCRYDIVSVLSCSPASQVCATATSRVCYGARYARLPTEGRSSSNIRR